MRAWCLAITLALSAPGGGAWAQTPTPDSTARADSLSRHTLAPLEVTVTRTDADLRRVPFAVEAVTRQDFARGRAQLALDEALAAVPGVLAFNRQNYAQDVVLSTRGFGSRTQFGVRGLKILLDGIPQTLPDGQGQLTNLALDDVERVEILRGSASSLYGNASGGVISLWTDGPRPTAITPVLRVMAGDSGLMKYRAGIDAPVGRATISASGERMVTRGFRVHSRADTRQGRLRVSLPVGPMEVALLAQLADSPDLEDPGAVTLNGLNLDSTANPLNVTRDVGKDVQQYQLGMTATRPVGRGTVSTTVFGIQRNLSNPIASAYIELDRWAYGVRIAGAAPFTLGRTAATLNAGVDGQWLRDDRLNLNVARTATTRDQLELVNELGPFAQLTVTPTPRITATVGARYDRVRFEAQDRLLTDGDDSGVRLMDAPSGSVGFSASLHDAFTPYASVSTSFETPTTTELGNQPTGPGGFNPTLDPQTAVNYELGARGVIAGRVQYSAALYRAEVRDELIPFDVPGFPGRRFFRNAGSSRHQGLELGVTAAPVRTFRLRAAYTWSDHRFTSYQTSTAVLDGNRLPGVPQHYLSASATVDIARWGWVTVEEGIASWAFADDLNTARNAGWSVTSVRLGLDLSRGAWGASVFGGVSNLWDARYAGSVQVNAANGRYYEPAAPRNVVLGIEVGARR